MGIIIPQTLISKNINKNQKRKPNKPKENSDPDIAQLIDGLSRTRDKSPSASRIDRRTRVGQTHRFVYYESYTTLRNHTAILQPMNRGHDELQGNCRTLAFGGRYDTNLCNLLGCQTGPTTLDSSVKCFILVACVEIKVNVNTSSFSDKNRLI